MHEDLVLRKARGDEFFKHLFDDFHLLVGHRVAAVAADVPLGEKIDFPAHHGAVVFGQHAGFGSSLPLDERIRGRIHQTGRVVFVKNVKIRLATEIVHENKTAFFVGGKNLGDIEARRAHQRVDLEKRRDRLFCRRRVHHNISTRCAAHAEVAAETRVGACRLKAGRIETKFRILRLEPAAEFGEAFVFFCLHEKFPAAVRHALCSDQGDYRRKAPLVPAAGPSLHADGAVFPAHGRASAGKKAEALCRSPYNPET